MKRSNQFVPANYEEFYTYYVMGSDSLVNSLIRSIMPYSTVEEREDLAHGVIVRAMEHRMIERYDPTKANFGGVVFFVTRSVITHHLHHKEHNVLTNAHTLTNTDAEEFEVGSYSIERMFGTDSTKAYEASSSLDAVVKFAKECEARAANKRDRSILPLVQLMAAGYDSKECAERLGVQPSTISNWTAFIRSQVHP